MSCNSPSDIRASSSRSRARRRHEFNSLRQFANRGGDSSNARCGNAMRMESLPSDLSLIDSPRRSSGHQGEAPLGHATVRGLVAASIGSADVGRQTRFRN